MAIRTDIYSVDWNASPRIINIDIANTVANAQDLYDTCKHLEALESGIDEPILCNAGGWEPLGEGVFVVITVSLFNAKYKFEDRPGPDWVICNMLGGNVVAFEDYTQAVVIYPREPSSYVSADRSAASSGTVKEINTGSGLTPEEQLQLAEIRKATVNDAEEVNYETTIYEDDGVTPWKTYDTNKPSPGNAKRIEK